MQKDVLDEKLYTSTEVAEILGVSLRSIYRYMEEGKLKASVRTATGRHRFTRKDINDFLKPSATEDYTSAAYGEYDELKEQGSEPEVGDMQKQEEGVISSKLAGSFKEAFKEGTPSLETKSPASATDALDEGQKVEATQEFAGRVDYGFEKSRKGEGVKLEEKQTATEGDAKYVGLEEKEEIKEKEEEEEEIDWLERFRQAAEKYRQASASKFRETATEQAKSSDYEEIEFADRGVKGPKVSDRKFNYYKSGIGGLKEIAQALDKSAKNASLDYAFTMNAGLSLHKPIKPFSLIHAYVRPRDLSYFEKVLQLTPVDKEQAQLCLITSNDDSIYSQVVELHGLYAVSNERLREDLIEEGEFELADEIE